MENFIKKPPMPNPVVVQSEELYKVFLDFPIYTGNECVSARSRALKELRIATENHPLSFFGTCPDAGQLMAMILKLVNTKKTIEIGVFTGYSLLLTALTIPEDGKITAIDAYRKTYDEIGLPIIRKAGLEQKINFIESQALPVLDKLLEDAENEGRFDFAFVDADKDNYWNYHKRLMKLVKVGGVIIYDNTLWGGTVTLPEEVVHEDKRASRQSAIEFNKSLSADPCVEISLVSIGDGSTICRRIS